MKNFEIFVACKESQKAFTKIFKKGGHRFKNRNMIFWNLIQFWKNLRTLYLRYHLTFKSAWGASLLLPLVRCWWCPQNWSHSSRTGTSWPRGFGFFPELLANLASKNRKLGLPGGELGDASVRTKKCIGRRSYLSSVIFWSCKMSTFSTFSLITFAVLSWLRNTFHRHVERIFPQLLVYITSLNSGKIHIPEFSKTCSERNRARSNLRRMCSRWGAPRDWLG